MKNYLICNSQDITDIDGNFLGKRVCDVSEEMFPVGADYEWKQYEEFVDVYTGFWYWADNKPNQYIAPGAPITAALDAEQPTTEGTQTL